MSGSPLATALDPTLLDASDAERIRPDARLVRRLLALLKPSAGLLGWLAAIEMVIHLSIFLRPWFLGQVIDHGLVPTTPGGIDWQCCLLMAGGLSLVWLVRFGFGATAQWVSGRISVRLLADMRHAVFSHVQRLSLRWFDRSRAGRIISRVDRDVDAMEAAVVHAPPEFASIVLRCIGAAAMLAWLDVRLLYGLLPLVVALALAVVAFQRMGIAAWGAVAEAKSSVTAHLCETITGVKVVQQAAAESQNIGYYRELLRNLDRTVITAAWRWGWFQPFTALLFILGTAALLIEGGRALALGELTLGQIAQAIFYVFMFLGPLQEIGDLFEKVASASASATRVFALLDQKPDIVDAPDAQALPDTRGAGAVEFRDVTFRYRSDGPAVIDHLHLQIAAGQTLALVGPTGHGKTTLAHLLARFYDLSPTDGGTILLDGRDIRSTTQASLRRQVAVVLQDNLLFSGTVADNLRLARPGIADHQLTEAVRTLGADDVLERLPKGLATEVGPLGAHLSAGQRQLVCLVRAWLADPAVLVLDEATSAIDPHTERRLQRAFALLSHERTTLIIAHRLATIRNADRIAVIDHGTVTEYGTHDELLTGNGHYAALVAAGGSTTC